TRMRVTFGPSQFGGTPIRAYAYVTCIPANGYACGGGSFYSFDINGKREWARSTGTQTLTDGSLAVTETDGWTVYDREGTAWRFKSMVGSSTDPNARNGYLTSLRYADGETLTYYYSSTPTYGDTLRSIVSSSGFHLHIGYGPGPNNTTRINRVTLINRANLYCDPLAVTCPASSISWPTLSSTYDSATNTYTWSVSGERDLTYSSQQGAQIGTNQYGTPLYEWNASVASSSGVTRTFTVRDAGPATAEPQGVGECENRTIVWRAASAAATWSYSYETNDIQGQGCFITSATSTAPDGSRVTLTGDQLTDELNRRTTYTFDTVTWPIAPYTSERREVQSITYPSQTRADFDHDERRNLRSTTLTPPSTSADPVLTWSRTYPTSCTAATAATCNQPTYEIDARGNRTDYTYDSVHGGVLTRTLPPSASGVRPQTRYTYQQLSARYLDSSGATVSGPAIWKLVSTSACRTQASCAGTADEVVTRYTYNANLLPATETTGSGDRLLEATVTRTYDPVGNVIYSDGPDEGTADTTRFTFDALRRPVATLSPDPDGTGSLPVRVVRNSYNDDDQITEVAHGTAATQSDESLALMSILRRVITAYDTSGRRTRESTISTGGATIYVTQYSYNAVNRLECSAVRMNTAVFTSLPASACTPGTEGSYGADRITRNVYDAAGQRVQLREGVGSDAEAAEATWAYDSMGQVTTLIDANGNRATMAYDSHGRRTRWTFPSRTRPSAYNPATQATALSSAGSVNSADYEAYQYDANGNRTLWRRRDASELTFGYDALNLMTTKIVPERTTSAPGAPAIDPVHTRDVYYAYDLRGLMTRARFDSASGEGVTNGYDALGRRTSSSIRMGGVTRTLNYEYDPAGNRTRITHPDGTYFVTKYDQLERPTQILANGTASLATIGYNANGRPSSVGRGNGTTATLSYDGVQRVNRLTHGFAGTADDVSWTYYYNAAGQLRQAVRNNDSYAYVLANSTRSYTTNGLNQYTALDSTSYAYDNEGNFASSGAATHVYDMENRLLSASGAYNVGLTYDPLWRLWQVAGGTTKQFLASLVALARRGA
ncbi:MAG: hypothetical protein M3177_07495, partial [Pseudomonadota bacterium]|nr:hypothetical protein [Pseudomonadota bacterium]